MRGDLMLLPSSMVSGMPSHRSARGRWRSRKPRALQCKDKVRLGLDPADLDKKRVEHRITLMFDLNRRIDDGAGSKRWLNHTMAGFIHHVIIEKESDLDQEVREWLREAYELHRR